MTHLEFYLHDAGKYDDFFAFVSCAPQVPQIGSKVVLLIKKGEGYKTFLVTDVEYWYDTIEEQSIPSAVVKIKEIPET